MAARYKAARNVSARSNTGILVSNPTQGMMSVCVVMCELQPSDRADPPSKKTYRLSISFEFLSTFNSEWKQVRKPNP
jgi:hypothetical protein